MSNTKSQNEINQAIRQLEELKPKVRPRTAFGDDNRAAIDAQIDVLRLDMSEDAIWDNWPDEKDMHVRDSARCAREWLDGEELEEGLIEGWESLVQN